MLNVAYNSKKVKAEFSTFIKQYSRKSNKNSKDPNDRQYDRKLEKIIKRMKPEEFIEVMDSENITK